MFRTYPIYLATPRHDHSIHDAIRRQTTLLARYPERSRRIAIRPVFSATA